MKKTFLLLIALFSLLAAMSQTISGSSTALSGQLKEYTIVADFTSPSWTVTSGATVLSQGTLCLEGGDACATIQFNTTGTKTVTFKDGSTTIATKNVTVSQPQPATPNTSFSASHACNQTTVSRNSNPPSGVRWYWQTSASGTSTSLGYSSSVVRTSGGTIYLRARTSNLPAVWSTSSQSYFYDVDATSVAGSVSGSGNRCGTGNVSYSITGYVGTIERWQSRYKNGSGGWSSWSTITETDNVTSVNPSLSQWSGGQRTYDIRATVKNGACSAVYSTKQTTVDPATVAGSISGVSNRCGTGATSYSISGYTGTIQRWQSRYKDGSGSWSAWSTITETDNVTSVSPTLTQWSSGQRTYEIRATVKSGSCTTLYPSKQTTVDRVAVAGSISGSGNRCGNGSVSYTLSGHTGTIDWWRYRYKNGSGGWSSWTTITNTDNVTNVSPSLSQWSGGQRTYEVQAKVYSGSCAAVYPQKQTTVDPVTVAGSINGATSMCGSGTSLHTISGYTGTIQRWQSRYKNGSGSWTGWTLITETDNVLSVSPTLSQWSGGQRTYEIRATVKSGTCSTLYPKKTVYVDPIPGLASGSNQSRCGTGTLSLTASTGTNGNTIRWYSAASGGTLLYTGTSYTTPSISSTTTYYAANYNSSTGCEDTNRDAVVATINPVPGLASGSNQSRCGAGTLTLTGTAGSNGNSIRWYSAASGGSLLHTGTSYTTPIITSTTTYYAASYNSTTGCTDTDRKAITATINPIPGLASGSNSSRCGTGTVALTASPGSNGTTVRWYSASSGGSPLYTGTSWDTPSISSTTTYYAASYNLTTGCEDPDRKAIVATINPTPGLASGLNQSRCGTGTLVLGATSGSNGNTIRWYSALLGGTSLHTGTSYTTPSLSSTTTYYAASYNSTTGCEDPDRKAIIATINPVPGLASGSNQSRCGTGTVTLTAAAGSNGDNIRWYSVASGGTLLQTGTSYTTPSISSTTTYYAASYNSTTGCEDTDRKAITATINPIPGLASGGDSSRCGLGTVALTASPGSDGTTIRWYASFFGGTPLFTGMNWDTPSISSTTTYYAASYNSSTGCEDTDRIAIVATINPIPDLASGSDQSRCGTGTLALSASAGNNGNTIRWYSALLGGSALHTGTSYTTPSISTTTTYYAASYNSTTGCEDPDRKAIIATVNPVPGLASGSNQNRCGTGTVALTATTGINGNNIRWYNAISGGTLLHTGTSYTTPSISSTTTYYAASYNSITGCEDTDRKAITATINPIPALASGNNSSRCGTGTVALTASPGSNGTTIRWYSVSSGGTPLYTGTNWDTPSISSNTTYYAASYNSGTGCEDTDRKAITAVINVIPSAPAVLINTGSTVCSGTSVTYTASSAYDKWYTTSSGGTAFHTGVSHTESLTSTTTYYVEGRNQEGCISTSRTAITVSVDVVSNPGTLSGAIEKFGVASGILNLTGQTGSILKWQYKTTGSWIDISNTTSSHNFTNIQEPTTYRVEVKNGVCSPVYSNVVLINVLDEISLDLGVSQNIRPGQETTLTADPGHSNYQWFKDDVSIQNGSSNQLVVTEPANYHTIVTSAGNAKDTTGYAVIANQLGVDQNAAITYSFRVPVTSSSPDLFTYNKSQLTISTNLFDGLGRPLQQVALNGSRDGLDLVTPLEYDDFGRQTKSYLPYEDDDTDVLFKPQALAANYSASSHYDYYVNTSSHADSTAFSETRFEASPLNRPLEQGAPGSDWQIGKHTVKFSYDANDSTEVFDLDFNTLLTQDTIYDSQTLFKNITMDEDSSQTITYTNQKGQTILKKSQVDETTWAETYYIYDDYGQLRVVLPPVASDSLLSGFFNKTASVRTAFLNRWAFLYDYDGRNRMISKKVPGADTVFMVYDKWDRLVLTQDGNQRSASTPEWLFTKYDKLNRPIMTGTMSSADDEATIRTNVESSSVRFESTDTLGTHQYTNLSYPTSGISEYLTVTYYDNYDFLDHWPEALGFNNPDALYSVQMNGTDQYIALDQSYSQAEEIDQITVEAWVKTDNGGAAGLISFDRSEYFRFTLHTNGKVLFATRSPSNIDDMYSATTNLNDGQWHHIAATYDGTDKRIYVDGVLDKEVMDPHGGEGLGTGVTRYGFIGAGSEASTFNGPRNTAEFDGEIGEVRLWHSVRAESEIDQYKDVPLTGNEAGLVGMWTMNDMTNGLEDETGNGNDGTLYNGPISSSSLKPGGMPLTQNGLVRGQVTGTMTKSGDGSWIKSASYYDDKYRLIQTQSTNHLGGKDAVTNYYDFVGQVLKSTSYHDDGTDSKQITRQFAYDHAGRLLKTWHQVNDEDSVLIAENSYNELGELIEKDLHEGEQSLDYSYNVRGWLTGINDSDLTTSADGDLFGMNLLYEQVDGDINNSALYNGNISGAKWSTPRDVKSLNTMERGYRFVYDGLNRLTAAHANRNTSTWTATAQFRTSYSYDLNGNIESLKREDKNGTFIDDLTYDYSGAGNQLQSVSDVTDSLGFYDGNTVGNDYAYDANGNMVKDLNKEIDSIYYNHLNLPILVDFATAGDSITYLYDAAGIKLQQKVYENDTLRKTTDYVGEFIYETGEDSVRRLQLIQHEEGRIIPVTPAQEAGVSYDYQYHLKDHLGNTRVTFSTTPENYTMTETFETGETNGFEDLHRFTSTSANTTVGGDEVERLQSGQTGAMVFISMNKGDTVDLSVQANYEVAPSGNSFLGTAFGTLFNSFDGIYGSGAEGGGVTTTSTEFSDALGGANMAGKSNTSTAPRAFLNYIFFDKDMNYLNAGFTQISTAALGVSVHETITLDVPVADREGYVLAYLSNENQEAVNVHFDDFTVYHGKTNVVQSDDYYPFGLTFNGYQRTASTRNFMNTFQDQEYEEETGWVKFKWRNHQPEIGRFFNVDPLAEKYVHNSPYAFSENKVTNHIELEGLEAFPAQFFIQAGALAHANSNGNPSFGDYARAAGQIIGNGLLNTFTPKRAMENAVGATTNYLSNEINHTYNQDQTYSSATDKNEVAINYEATKMEAKLQGLDAGMEFFGQTMAAAEGSLTGMAMSTFAKNGVSQATKGLIQDMVANPESSANQIATSFTDAGFDASVKQLKTGRGFQVTVGGHSQINNIKIHGGGGRHGLPRVQITGNNNDVNVKFINGSAANYNQQTAEKANLIFLQE